MAVSSFAISLTQVLGLFAGGLIMLAAMPQIVRNIRNPLDAAGQSIWRNILFIAGNLLWVVYGIVTGAPELSVMCSINVVMNGIIVAQMIGVRRHQRRAKCG